LPNHPLPSCHFPHTASIYSPNTKGTEIAELLTCL
jgi:hypothetical protein